MSQDDDDWVGTPPEGHYTRDRAKPEFWRSQRPPALIAGLIGIVVLILHHRHPPELTQPSVVRPSPAIGWRGPRKRGPAPVTTSPTAFTRATTSRACSVRVIDP